LALFTERAKLPGWAAVLVGIAVFVPDWHSRIEFWLAVAKGTGGFLAVLATLVGSPYFNPALVLAGLAWLAFAGESPRGVQRQRWLPYFGWSAFLLWFTVFVIAVGYGAIELSIQREISKRDEALQKRAASKPVFWRLTDLQKTALKFQLEQIPEDQRFEVKFECLPDAGSRTFVEDIGQVFHDQKWKIAANCLFSHMRPDLTGLYVAVSKVHAGKKIEETPKNAQTLFKILSSSEIPINWAIWDVENTKDDEFYLLVGNAP
jgi:hypothetical protein